MASFRGAWRYYVGATAAMVFVLIWLDVLPQGPDTIPIGTNPPRPRFKPRNEDQVYLCFKVTGRLGNALFMYASITGIARANNMTLVLTDDSVLPEVLKTPPRVDPDFDGKCRGARPMFQRKCCAFDERLVRLPHIDFYTIPGGCLISWVYFKNITQDISSLLEFRDDVMAQARQLVTEIRRKDNVTLVGMHVRRGDHTGFVARWRGHKHVTAEYITRAMTYFRNSFGPVHFVVASEDKDWCQRYVAGSGNDVTILENNSAAVDMAVLTLTDHMIISVGTYGWWAAYLNRGVKTYMKDFIVPGSAFASTFNNLDASEYFYPGWVPL